MAQIALYQRVYRSEFTMEVLKISRVNPPSFGLPLYMHKIFESIVFGVKEFVFLGG